MKEDVLRKMVRKQIYKFKRGRYQKSHQKKYLAKYILPLELQNFFPPTAF